MTPFGGATLRGFARNKTGEIKPGMYKCHVDRKTKNRTNNKHRRNEISQEKLRKMSEICALIIWLGQKGEIDII